MKRIDLAGIAITLAMVVSCGSENDGTTYPMRVVSERTGSINQYTQVDDHLVPADPAPDWSEPATEGKSWFASTFSLTSGEHQVLLVEMQDGATNVIADTSLKVRVDGSIGGPATLCMSADGSMNFIIEADDEVGQRPVGEDFGCYNPALRVRSSG